ncbi:DUF6970 domain-containing protein [Fibrella arboris]|uniref:DUF6970 domain-containing protein n=1 Tax=Fibrella arboris TaxID=3242486 RepID=UPI003520F804
MKVYFVLIGLSLLLSCQRDEPTPNDIPACIQTIIQKNGQLNTYPNVVAITRYKYQHRYVYLALSDCCDFPNLLYDNTCQTLCSPSGGWTGGDGRCANFFTEATEKTEIWQKTR